MTITVNTRNSHNLPTFAPIFDAIYNNAGDVLAAEWDIVVRGLEITVADIHDYVAIEKVVVLDSYGARSTVWAENTSEGTASALMNASGLDWDWCSDGCNTYAIRVWPEG